MNDDDRIAYLAGDDRPVPAEDQAELDELRAMLGDSALWADPPADLEDRVAAAISAESVATSPHASARRSLWWRVIGIAAALVIAVGVAITLTRGDTGGEHFAVALEAPAGSGEATGQADFLRTDSGWRIKLDASGLPRLDGGRFYQAWMRNDGGTLVPIGTFNEGNSVVLWSGVSPHDYPTLTVNEEEADGDQASSGRRVLAGTATFGD
jgi:anti-sigma-K factor RskA